MIFVVVEKEDMVNKVVVVKMGEIIFQNFFIVITLIRKVTYSVTDGARGEEHTRLIMVVMVKEADFMWLMTKYFTVLLIQMIHDNSIYIMDVRSSGVVYVERREITFVQDTLLVLLKKIEIMPLIMGFYMGKQAV